MPRKRRRQDRSKRSTRPSKAFLAEVDSFLEKGADEIHSPGPGKPEVEQESDEEASWPPREQDTHPAPDPDAATVPGAVEPPRLEVTLRDGGLKAVLVALHPHHSRRDVFACLQAHGITTGIARKAIQAALKEARQKDAPVANVVVAEGRVPVPPPPPRLDFRLPDGLTGMPSLEPLQSLLTVEQADALQAGLEPLTAWIVAPGDVLAEIVQEEGTPGVEVTGRPIPLTPEDGEVHLDPALEPGQCVTRSDPGSMLLATAYGCAGMLSGRVSVLIPLWIAADAMTACWLRPRLVPGSRALTQAALDAVFMEHGIRVGVDQAAVERLLHDSPSAEAPAAVIVVARGQPPTPPQDAQVELPIAYGLRAGAFRQDGSVDFKERNIFPQVRQGTLLASLRPADPGTPGQTVRGDEVPAAPGAQAVLVAGEHVRLEEVDGSMRLVAETEGGATLLSEEETDASGRGLRRVTISVLQIAELEGDLDYRTGNVDFQGNVVVNGSVQSGFRVRATGSIVIKGSVEAGAHVEAGGDITVGQGIVGRETRIISAKGSITAKFVHDAQLRAGVDIAIGSYLYGAQTQAAGCVNVQGLGGAGGGIVGGTTWAVREIATLNLGSQHSTSTRVYVGVEPEQHAQLRQADAKAQQAQAMLEKLLQAISLPQLTPQEVRRLIARTPARKQVILHYIKKARQLAQIRDTCVRQAEELSARMGEAAAAAAITVRETAYARSSIHIGSQRLVLSTEERHVRFSIDPEQQRISASAQ